MRPSRPILRRLAAIAGAGALAAAAASGAAAAADRPVVVVELFTSQGCSSCPPADAHLGELAARAEVVALGLHVDYWDRLGWKDPFAARWATERQRAYAAALGARTVYTPQMVIDGRLDVVGSRRMVVDAALDARARDPEPRVTVTLTEVGGRLALSVGAGAGRGAVMLARYQRAAVTDVPRGENAGRRLADVNAARDLAAVAEWTGAPLTLELAPPPGALDRGAGVAAFVQRIDGGRPGPILGAAKLER